MKKSGKLLVSRDISYFWQTPIQPHAVSSVSSTEAMHGNYSIYQYIHESLLKKEGTAFWKSWRSKFESTSKCTEVEGCSDQGVIADNFATHFSGCFTGNNRVETLKMEYFQMRSSYALSENVNIDIELVSNVILDLKLGKAAGFTGLTAEHLHYSHCIISVLLSYLFSVNVFISLYIS